MEKEWIHIFDTLWSNALYLGCGIVIGIWIIRGRPKI